MRRHLPIELLRIRQITSLSKWRRTRQDCCGRANFRRCFGSNKVKYACALEIYEMDVKQKAANYRFRRKTTKLRSRFPKWLNFNSFLRNLRFSWYKTVILMTRFAGRIFYLKYMLKQKKSSSQINFWRRWHSNCSLLCIKGKQQVKNGAAHFGTFREPFVSGLTLVLSPWACVVCYSPLYISIYPINLERALSINIYRPFCLAPL